ncbi:hypothetical protein VM1G_03355 [Cytospora mali]|uniref:Uncharacterized protein n=1 Tax=Cytospora mali TaxID=578113 RepID=A0A194VVT4_CYTMA|nr:hypothetical protein VM1G_03355 [Valsa mali]
MEKQDHHHGSLVAFEGPVDAVSTQLRLLPTSPHVLILPSIETYIRGGEDIRFSARELVRATHNAAQARHDVAMGFLRGASANSKRIVFLSGGTAGAVAQCISKISEHQAPGDFLKGESIFRNIVQGGVEGLDQEGKYVDERTLQMLGSGDNPENQYWGNSEVEDPITKAMRAADALDKETESLQPIDGFIRTRPRSLSLPMYGHADGMGEPSPFFVFGSPLNEDAQLNSDSDSDEQADCQQALEDDYAKEHSKRNQHGNIREHLVLSRPPSCAGEPYEPHTTETRSTVNLLSSKSDVVLLSPPATPEGVVYGEARLVQMRASRTNKPLRNTRSFDDLELHRTRRRRNSSINAAHLPKKSSPSDLPEAKSRHLSIVEDPYSSNNLLHLPQARFVKAHTTTIRKSPTFAKRLQKRLPRPARESYVHRGTDAAGFDDERHAMDEPFQPVLPLTEDLVIHFTSETHDPILEYVVQSFKSGSFRVFPFPLALSHTGQNDSRPSIAKTPELSSLEEQAWLPRVAEHHYSEKSDMYDPFAARGHDMRSSNLTIRTPSPTRSALPVYICQPPTPSQTPPPPVMNKMAPRFQDFSMTSQQNAVVIQNALRSVLESYFPPQHDGGYHQFSHSLLPDMDRLWSHIFRENETHGIDMSDRNMDLILAIGCQRGVKRDFLPALMGQIEKLGAKSSGMSRSGRLDIRYLIANAMQSFTAQPLAHQIHNNPFENPYLLACLIIPHLETYLAAHPSIRFLLLEYPAEHLATVLALQKLIGINILKVAGIINSEATSPTSDVSSSPSSICSFKSWTPFNNIDTKSLDSINLGGQPCPDNKSTLAHRRKYSFSKANYLLTCSATESEIAVFISTIWKLLIEVDSFYIPERSLSQRSRPPTAKSIKGTIIEAVPLPKLTSKFTIQDRNNNSSSSAYTHTSGFGPAELNPPMSPHYVNIGEEAGGGGSSTPRIATSAASLAHDFPFPPPPPPRSISPSPSTTSTRSQGRSTPGHMPGQRSRSRSNTRRRLGRAAEAGDDGASLYAVSVVDEGEFYDDEERRLMPMYMRQRELRKGNSRKALKWLGLA